MEKHIQCPSCGGNNEIHNPGITMVLCQFCGTACYWDKQAVLQAGNKAVVPPDDTRLFFGASCTIDNKVYKVIGHLRYDFGRGHWDEWYLANIDGDGSFYWLSEDGRRLMLEAAIKNTDSLPQSSELIPGQFIKLANQQFSIREINKATLIGGQGQLPFTVLPGETYSYADLASQDGKHFGTIEYLEQGKTKVFIGKPIAHEDLQVHGNRPTVNIAAETQNAAGIKCAHCGAALQRPKQPDAQTLVCAYCGAQNDCTTTELKVLGINKGKKPRFQFELGHIAYINSIQYEICGRMENTDDEGYRSRQYLLYNKDQGYLYLEEEEGEYLLLESTHATPHGDPFDLDEGDSITINGKRYSYADDGVSTLLYVDGALPWLAKVGDKNLYVDCRKGQQFYSIEKTSNEIEYYHGHVLNSQDLQTSFGLQPTQQKKNHRPASSSTPANTIVTGCISKFIFSSFLLAFAGFALFIITALNGLPGSMKQMAKDALSQYETVEAWHSQAVSLYEKTKQEKPSIWESWPASSEWPAFFKESKNKLDDFNKNYVTQLNQLLEKDDRDDHKKVLQVIEHLNTDIQPVYETVKRTLRTEKNVIAFHDNSKEILKAYVDAYKIASDTGVQKNIKAVVAQAQKDWPQKNHVLANQLQKIQKTTTFAINLWKQYHPHFKRAQEGILDKNNVPQLYYACERMIDFSKELQTNRQKLQDKTQELYTSWDKILIDMDIQEGLDVSFRHQIKTISLQLDSQKKLLKKDINSQWISVDKKTYDLYDKYLGMSIERKLAGAFNSEAVKAISPPGYMYISEGTDQKSPYGQWQTVKNERRWVWFPAFAFIGPLYWGRYYSPLWSHYTYYHRYPSRPYLGRGNSGSTLFGSHGYVTKNMYPRSNYIRTGGFRTSRYIRSGRTFRGQRFERSYRRSSYSGSRFGGGK